MPKHERSHPLLSAFLILLVLGVLVAVAAVYAVSQAGYWLEAPAQRPGKADAIVVLGGDDGERALRALTLYRDGFAKTIVLTGLQRGVAAPPAHLNWRAELLYGKGVPKSALMFEVESRHPHEEAEAVLKLMRKQGWKNVLVVADPPNMRRLLWTWERVFNGTGLQYTLVATAPQWWRADHWWWDEEAGAAVIQEYAKLGYYVFKQR
jgi:uncharacterized SAM-binding protein YcdF (DUF218 family)